jgi:hypothetical protein
VPRKPYQRSWSCGPPCGPGGYHRGSDVTSGPALGDQQGPRGPVRHGTPAGLTADHSISPGVAIPARPRRRPCDPGRIPVRSSTGEAWTRRRPLPTGPLSEHRAPLVRFPRPTDPTGAPPRLGGAHSPAGESRRSSASPDRGDAVGAGPTRSRLGGHSRPARQEAPKQGGNHGRSVTTGWPRRRGVPPVRVSPPGDTR